MASKRSRTLRMHESAAMRLCQLAFLLMGALPVVVSLGWIALEWTPGYRSARQTHWEQTLSNKLGLSVEIEFVQPTGPKASRLSGITFRDAESKAVVCRLESAYVESHAGRCSVQIAEAEFFAGQAFEAWRKTHDWLLRRPDQLSGAVEISIEQLHWRSESPAPNPGEIQSVAGLASAAEAVFSEVRLVLSPGEGKQDLGVEFLPGELPVDPSADPGAPRQPTKIVISRKTEHRPADDAAEQFAGYSTSICLKTGSDALPLGLIAEAVPAVRKFGQDAAFSGVVDLTMGNGWKFQLNASTTWEVPADAYAILRNVDYGRLTWGTEVRLQGTGMLAFQKGCITDQGVRDLSGVVMVGTDDPLLPRSHVGSLFLREFGRHLDVDIAAETLSASSRSDYAFDWMQLWFGFDSGVLQISGDDTGVIMVGEQQTLASRAPEKISQPIPVTAIVDLLDRLAAQPGLSTRLHGAELGKLSSMAERWLPKNPPTRTAAQSADLTRNR